MEAEAFPDGFGGPGPEDRRNGAAGLAAALRRDAATLAATAAGLRQALATPFGDTTSGPLADIRRQRGILAAAAEAAMDAALLLEAAALIAPGGEAAALAPAIRRAAERSGLPPARLAPALRAAALALATDDGAARIAASSLAEALATALDP